MKNVFKSLIAASAIVIAASSLTGCGTYNSIQSLDEQVAENEAKMMSVYQERADKIPNLIATVKGAAAHEKSTLTEVTELRASVGKFSPDKKMTAEEMEEYLAAQQKLSQGIGRLMAITENYPDLKANQNFLELQKDLTQTEAKATSARNRYIRSIADYNKYIRRFPTNIIASIFGHDAKQQMKFDETVKTTPKVQF